MSLPKFHMHEQTGEMTRIVSLFLLSHPLYPEELEKLRLYVHQWVDAMPAKPADYDRIKTMTQTELENYCSEVLMDHGIDPF